jgi:hypothetical protein
VNEDAIVAQWRMDRPARDPRTQSVEQPVEPPKKKSLWQRLFS